MRALKRLATHSFVFVVAVIGIHASYNSFVMSNNSYMKKDYGIAFTKRLDEMNGVVVAGRVAASVPTFQKKSFPAPRKVIVQKVTEKQSAVKKLIEPERIPAINKDLELEVTGVFAGKALQKGTFSGHAVYTDGRFEELSVFLPNGQEINIYTRDQLNGNVFAYQDSETGEEVSGMFYEVKPGQYMVRLTNDSNFPNAKIEFSAHSDDFNQLDYSQKNTEKSESFKNTEYAKNNYYDEYNS